jgi:hypothetical protein
MWLSEGGILQYVVPGMNSGGDMWDPEIVTTEDVELLRNGFLEERHLPEGLSWEDLVLMVKKEVPELWQLLVLEHQQEGALPVG